MSIPAAVIDSLPNEILETILFHLVGCDVAKARAVCQRWYELVKGSIALQYRLELALEGYSEDTAHPVPLSLSDRVAALRRFTTCWSEFLVPADRIVTLENFPPRSWNCLPVSRWLVDYGDSDRCARISAFPPEDATVGPVWRDIPLDHPHDAWNRMFSLIALPTLEMLITVGSRTLEDGLAVPVVRLLHIDSFKPHPLAAHHELPWPPGAELGEMSVAWVGMGLCNSTLSVTFLRFDDLITVVWNWVLGTIIHVAPSPLPHFPHGLVMHNQVLLAENTLCWVEYETYDPQISEAGRAVLFVMQFDGSEPWGDTRILGRWGFPTMRTPDTLIVDIVTDEADEMDACFRLNAPNPFISYTRASTLPVEVTDNLIGIRMAHVTFYALRSTFLRQRDTDAVVPWEEWGAENTRCLLGGVHAIHGCKALHQLEPMHDLTLRSTTLALNFTPTKCRAAAPHDLNPSFIDSPNELEAFAFLEPISTRLPYLQTRPPETQDASTESVPIPTDAKLWWEEGRVVWAGSGDGDVVHVAFL
ncbi:hypothetical protein EXIGLDRAFT_841553 [Exidia glandulosa HHB12029]|uniref:F-box domain-containing protein n=1 Tax=Exidia glandulosa HHB12029 TaxID=1314781 RepID=A0A165DUA5_EXIGL|nr:hypothetical protein EXIGLDRAFT_841553 [Exidia glandulosa HHB12029]